jgi:hypothetical protein
MFLNYKPFLQQAYRQVVRQVLAQVADQGLCGDSHYFITFRTDRSDVIMPDFVRAKYPEEISVVLQNQFSNLIVTEKDFRVDLTFGGVLSTLVVPWTAIKIFADPAAQFMLSFDSEDEIEKTAKSENTETNVVSTNTEEDIIDLTKLRTGK